MITHVQGDATLPMLQPGRNVIVHCVNDIGVWGAGFVVPLGRRYPAARAAYMRLGAYQLGSIQLVNVSGVEDHLYVCNLFGQRGVASPLNPTPIRYEAFEDGFATLEEKLQEMGGPWTIHMPKMGAGLAGGKWDVVEALIESQITFPVYVYTPKPALVTT